MSRRLTLKQQRWVNAYLGAASGNGVEACRIAGYKGSDAVLASTARDNTRKPHIAEALASAAHSGKDGQLVANRDDRQRYLTAVMRGEDGDPSDTRARLKACELLGKTQGDFIDRRQVEHQQPPEPQVMDFGGVKIIF